MEKMSREQAGKLVDSLKDASDFEIAMYWVRELRYPCVDPKNPEHNLGKDWCTSAKRALAEMKAKQPDQQNQYAIKMLEEAIKEFEADPKNM